ncbi:MAG: phage tail protein I [Rhodobacteraceae bacterium]|nr:phage tail protein I [Paracoccaceae bacterium]
MAEDHLLPPNATAQEIAFARTTARLSDVDVPLRDLWNPETCPAALLPWLAWAFSVDAWQPYWSEAAKRARIGEAVARHRRKGTARAVREVVGAYGASIALREWWELSPRGTPHTFQIVLTVGDGADASAEVQQDIIAEVGRVKPVRSHFTLIAGASAAGGIGVAGAARAGLFRRLRLTEAPWRGALGLAAAARPAAFRRLSLSEV